MFGKHPGHHIPSPESEIPEIPNPALETQHVTLKRVKTSSQSDSAQISFSLSFLENKNTRWQIGDDHFSSAAPRLETKRCHFSAFFSTNVLVQWKGSRRDLNPVRVKSKSGHIGKTFCSRMFFLEKNLVTVNLRESANFIVCAEENRLHLVTEEDWSFCSLFVRCSILFQKVHAKWQNYRVEKGAPKVTLNVKSLSSFLTRY